jgi:hypothetical protein
MKPANGENVARYVVPDPELLVLAGTMRARAEEALAKAETMSDADARETVRTVAASYERLAQRVEQEISRTGEA